MQPIFAEYIRFLNYHNCNTEWFRENTFWLDNNIVKAFKQGKVISLYRVSVDDKLNLNITKHKQNKDYSDFETWKDTINRNRDRIKQLEQESIYLLQQHGLHTERRIINTNSTGKDSMVVTHLAKKAKLDFETFFNVTTLDVAESNRMAKRNQYKPIYPNPKYGGFYKYIQRYNQMIPSRLNRFCCKYFKESPTIEYFNAGEKLLFLFGMRNQESLKRSNYQDVWRNEKWDKRDWIAILPIRKWTEFDIWLYILAERIEINDKYKYGYNRVGCGIACPNYTKYTWILDQYWYPYMFNRWRNILRNDFISNSKWLIMNCTIDEYISKTWTGGVCRPEPTNEVIQEYATYSGLGFNVAEKYFNKYCSNGCINRRRMPMKIKDKNALAMNMKMFGRDVEKFKCKKCLMKEFGWNQEQWDQQVKDFKAQGCKLF